MQQIITLILLFCVLALGVQGEFTDKDFEEIESEHYNPPVTPRPSRSKTTTRLPVPVTPRPTTRRPSGRPILTTTTTTTTTTLRPTNPGIDGNGQLIGCPCRSTQESNSVCGTDGNTYGNLGKLKCAQKCGHPVEVNFLGGCKGRS